MAGRDVSVTHQALGTVRVMKTCGMMGEVVGKAASICALHNCTPREVYQKHLDELLELLELPGKARRSTPSGEITIDEGALPRAPAYGPPTGIDPQSLPGLILDDRQAELEGQWTDGTSGRRYVGYTYKYASGGSGAKATYTVEVNKRGRFQIGLRSAPFDNRATAAPVEVRLGDRVLRKTINYQGSTEGEFIPVAVVDLAQGETVEVVVLTDGAKGFVHLDALQLLERSPESEAAGEDEPARSPARD
jgi:hypothetical protein